MTAAFAVLPLLVAMPLGRLTDRLRSVAGVLAVGGVLLAAGAWIMSTTSTLLTLALSSAVLGLGQLAFMLAGQAVIARWSSDALLDRAFGLFTAAIAVGQLLGPLLVGALLGTTRGPELAVASRHAFWVAAGVAALAVPFAVVVAARTSPAPRDCTGQWPAARRRPRRASACCDTRASPPACTPAWRSWPRSTC